MKKSDAKFSKTIANIVSENSLEHLKIQSVIDQSWSHGYRKGWTKGYFSGLIATGSVLAVAWVWRTVGRLEGSEKGTKEADFWRKLYSFRAGSKFGENSESSDKKSSDKDDIDGDTEVHDDPGATYDRWKDEGKC